MPEVSLWKNLAESIKTRWSEITETIELKRGQFVYQTGDAPKGLYWVESGLIGLTILGSSGRDHLLRFFRRGQFFGHRALLSSEPYHGTTVALESTRLILIPRADILNTLQREPNLYADLAQQLAFELKNCETQRVMILENQILSRVAQSVLYLKELHPDYQWTRQEIANFCASTTSTVIKAMAELEARELIRQQGRDIEIRDREGLLSLAE